ncbi:hypothetical protein, partial [Methylobacterium crusticola]|uniref:hypothetical protein n=1 Tax=Methylobacterium crusticola TaxID=1697972 RepID=UPI001EE1CE99
AHLFANGKNPVLSDTFPAPTRHVSVAYGSEGEPIDLVVDNGTIQKLVPPRSRVSIQSCLDLDLRNVQTVSTRATCCHIYVVDR